MDNKIDSLRKNGADLSKEAMIVKIKTDSILNDFNTWKQDYILNNPSLFGYSMLINDIRLSYENINLEYVNKAYTILKEKFPDHPYTAIADNSIKAVNNLSVGGIIIDFNAPDVNCKDVTPSKIIKKNKHTLVNLWAPWCGPCIRKNRQIVPIYEKYKKDGFDVVSVIGEFDDMEDFDNISNKENYPWENLIEINSQNQIWEKYNMKGDGGAMFLVDNTGKTLISRPTPKEIEDLLKEG